MSKNRSETLSQKLDNTIETWVLDSLKQLEWLFDPELFEQFNARIKGIIDQHPDSQEIVAQELERTSLVAQNHLENYTRQYQSILLSAANDDISEDDDEQDFRPYGWLGKAA